MQDNRIAFKRGFLFGACLRFGIPYLGFARSKIVRIPRDGRVGGPHWTVRHLLVGSCLDLGTRKAHTKRALQFVGCEDKLACPGREFYELALDFVSTVGARRITHIWFYISSIAIVPAASDIPQNDIGNSSGPYGAGLMV